ncbi:MAG: hypothetical protein PF448_06685 [Bacteroidales bacterium]|jgi:hypothetical protein|nr:hypothetical protein [Bacteroidales bacterium]
MDKYVSVIIVLFSLMACERQYIDIDEAERPFFENNDTIVFMNQHNEADSFLIRMYYDYQYSSEGFKEQIDYYYIALKNEMLDSLTFSVGIGGIHDLIYLKSQYQFHTEEGSSATTINQNGSVFTSVYTFCQDTAPPRVNNDSLYGLPEIVSVLYTSRHGIINYEKKNGEIFKIINNED